MKFKLLAIGDKFELQGEVYVKTSPIIASNVSTNHNKMVPGYTAVKLLTQGGKEASVKENLNCEEVMTAFNEFYSSCLALLEDKTALETARDKFIKTLTG
jgi:hypothetical protein